jgi:hypothetical protein
MSASTIKWRALAWIALGLVLVATGFFDIGIAGYVAGGACILIGISVPALARLINEASDQRE